MYYFQGVELTGSRERTKKTIKKSSLKSYRDQIILDLGKKVVEKFGENFWKKCE